MSTYTARSADLIEAILPFDCVVLRGLPGSGKSTFASLLARSQGFVHLEADGHFMVNGKYVFDPLRVADAHAVVVRDALSALQAGRKVAVANTHVRLWEMAGIVGAVRLAGRKLCFVECLNDWDNIHDVPQSALDAMRTRWEPLPAEFRAIAFTFTANSGE
ncbi:MAG: AAA family ATPase [Casimicrobium sp.]